MEGQDKWTGSSQTETSLRVVKAQTCIQIQA